MVAVGDRPQPIDVSEGFGRARLCAYVKHPTLNSALEQKLCDRRVDHRASATSSANKLKLNPSIQKAGFNL